MRRAVGWLLVALGLAAVLLGAVVAVVFGPDDRAQTGPHPVSTAGSAVATAPAVLRYAGPRLEITVSAQDPDRTVFVGLATDVDVADYLRAARHTRVDAVDLPWDVETTAVPGVAAPPAVPAVVDWWLVSREAPATTTLGFRLPDAEVDVVAMDARLRPGFRADVTVAWVQDGAFLGGIAIAVAGMGAAVAGWVVRAPDRGPVAA